MLPESIAINKKIVYKEDVNCTYVKLYIKLVFDQLVNVPTLSKPPSSVAVWFKSEPVIVVIFVLLYILQENMFLFFCTT